MNLLGMHCQECIAWQCNTIFIYISYDIYVDLVSLVACLVPSNIDFQLWWFFLFYVLVYKKIFCAVGALCMFSYF